MSLIVINHDRYPSKEIEEGYLDKFLEQEWRVSAPIRPMTPAKDTKLPTLDSLKLRDRKLTR